jgi:hypothetical protein
VTLYYIETNDFNTIHTFLNDHRNYQLHQFHNNRRSLV